MAKVDLSYWMEAYYHRVWLWHWPDQNVITNKILELLLE